MNRVTIKDLSQSHYYQLFKYLFNSKYQNMSNDSKVLYALLYDRLKISVKNNWVNDKGEVYIIFTVENLMDLMNVSKPSAIKYKKELKSFQLLDEEQQGRGKPNLLFLKLDIVEDFEQSTFNIYDKYFENETLNTFFIKYLKMREEVFETTFENDIKQKFFTDQSTITSLINRLKKLADNDFEKINIVKVSTNNKWANFFEPNFRNINTKKDLEDIEQRIYKENN